MKHLKSYAVALTLILLTSCSNQAETQSSTTQTPAPDTSTTQTAPDPVETAPPEDDPPQEEEIPLERGDTTVNLVMLTGPTGMGAAKLIADNLEDATRIPYEVTMLPDNNQAVAMLTSGEADIAALSTSVAATLYNKASNISVVAVNTLGVLYLLEKGGETVLSIEELEGKTLWATGQGANPEYILEKLLTSAGVDPESVNVEWLTAEEVQAKMLTEEEGIAMLPVPASTALLLQDDSIKQTVNLNTEWTRLVGSGLPMGCVVARNDFIEENPETLALFLADYEASIDYMTSDNQDTPQLVVDAEISPSLPVATLALPDASLTFISGTQMHTLLQAYYVIMFQANPDSIGGGQPYDDFYYGIS